MTAKIANLFFHYSHHRHTLRSLNRHHRRWYTPPMEVEVKLRLPDSASHQKLSDLLSPFHSKTHFQENLFFDGPNSELTSNLAVLRLRFYDLDTRAVVSLKAKPVISDGISRIEEEEEPIDPAVARVCAAEPWRLLSMDTTRIVKRVRDEYRVKGLVGLGGFRNVRAVYDWKGLKLEVDESSFDFGTHYEIECECEYPDRAKKMLEDLLNQNGISYAYSQVQEGWWVAHGGKGPGDRGSTARINLVIVILVGLRTLCFCVRSTPSWRSSKMWLQLTAFNISNTKPQ